jgi:hypothetical protein
VANTIFGKGIHLGLLVLAIAAIPASALAQIKITTGYQYEGEPRRLASGKPKFVVPISYDMTLDRFTFLLAVDYPKSVRSSAGKWETGIGDAVVRGGFKALEEGLRFPEILARVQVKFPTADSAKGIGTGEHDFRVDLLLTKKFGRTPPMSTEKPWVLTSSASRLFTGNAAGKYDERHIFATKLRRIVNSVKWDNEATWIPAGAGKPTDIYLNTSVEFNLPWGGGKFALRPTGRIGITPFTAGSVFGTHLVYTAKK